MTAMIGAAFPVLSLSCFNLFWKTFSKKFAALTYTVLRISNIAEFTKNPLSWNLTNIVNPAILHLSLTTHAFGNSLRNNCLLELFVFLDAGTSFGEHCINFRTFFIKKAHKLVLFDYRRNKIE